MADRDLEVSGFLQSITGGAQEEKVRRQRRAEQTERLQQIAKGSQTPLSSTLAATLGDALGKGMLRAFGVEDAEIEQARRLDQLQEYMSTLDLTTEQGNMELANVYRQMGDPDKAVEFINVAKNIAKEKAALAEVKEPTEQQVKRIESQIINKYIASGAEIDDDVITNIARAVAFEIEEDKARLRVAGAPPLRGSDYLAKAMQKFTSPQRADGSTNPFQVFDFEVNEQGMFEEYKGNLPGAYQPIANAARARQDFIDEDLRRQQMMAREERQLNREMQPAVDTTGRPQTIEQVAEQQRRKGAQAGQEVAESARGIFGRIGKGLLDFVLDPESKREIQRPRQ